MTGGIVAFVRAAIYLLRMTPLRLQSVHLALLLPVILLLPSLAGAAPAGTVISNTATALYSGGISSQSNTVTVIAGGGRSTSTIEILQYAPGAPGAQQVAVAVTGYSSSNTASGPFVPLAPPVPAGSSTPISLALPVPLEPATLIHQGMPVFVRLTDADQNLDALVQETVLVRIQVAATGDDELLRLTETSAGSGVFTGYIQSYGNLTNPAAATPANGKLGLHDNAVITASYVDPQDATDSASASTLVDPFGLVIDSRSGTPLSGAQITLVDSLTGLPATVYGDDGISAFPASVVSGAVAIDSSGTTYPFGPGEYRFPFVAPGSYRLQVVPPGGYDAPSSVSAAALQALPGAPFAIDAQASYGQTFSVVVGPAIRIDIPLDPQSGGFFLVKDADQREVASGDFLQYRLTLENRTGALLNAVQIVDTLPRGLRYQPGSTFVDNRMHSDPQITAAGSTLTFDLGDIPDGVTVSVRYLVEVVTGASYGNLVNRARASANGGALLSMPASVSVKLHADLLTERNVLMGRVLAGDCAAPDEASQTGVSGVRIYLENGSYVTTDEQGMYHLEGVRAGSHVLQMDLDTLGEAWEPVVCDEQTRFAGRAFSRFVDLQGGSLWRTDFHVRKRPPPQARVSLAFDSAVRDQLAGYHLVMQGGDVALVNGQLLITLPPSGHYVSGSSVLDNRTIDDPQQRGAVLIYSLGDLPPDWRRELNFLVDVDPFDGEQVLEAKALLRFALPGQADQRTPVVTARMQRLRDTEEIRGSESTRFDSLSAVLSLAEEQALRDLAARLQPARVLGIEASGHTDNLPIRAGSQAQFADNYLLSLARARAVAGFLARQLMLPESAVVIHGHGAAQPYVPNVTAENRASNRRVELRISTESLVPDTTAAAGAQLDSVSVSVTGDWQDREETARVTSLEQMVAPVMPRIDASWLAQAQPGVELLWPPQQYSPSISSVRVAVKHAPDQQVSVRLNGVEISALNYDGVQRNAAGTVAVSQWAGVDLEDGSNRLLVEIRDAHAALVARIERDVRMASLPVRAELVAEQSQLLADGRQNPLIAVRLLDRDGRPVRAGLIGEFSVQPPYTAQLTVDQLQREPLGDPDAGTSRYRVGKDGIALIELAPTTRSGEVVLQIPLQTRAETLRPWLQPAPRDWILVGLAEGGVAYNTVNGNLQSIQAAGLESDTLTDGKLSFFAKGAIKGEWLLTLAYDSDKDRQERDRLFQQIDPDEYFTVYGDRSAQDYDASSRERLFVRLERRQFYALFGDYRTGLTVTELARFDRALTGYKSELRSEHLNLNVFASDSAQGFIKDEIRGDGTSGLYRLRAGNVVLNSEQVSIVTRDRFRPQVVLSTQVMTRHVDYDLDTSAGTLFFRQPVPSKDAALNPVYIVVDYETQSTSSGDRVYGGRAAVPLLDNRAEVGATYVQQEQGSAADSLSGVDARMQLTGQTQLKLEYASSQQTGVAQRSARFAELNHDGETLDGSVYFREQEAGFGLGQQSRIGSGTRLVGADTRARLSDRNSVTAQVFRQSDLQTDAVRDVLESRLVHETKRSGASVGLRSANDRYTNGSDNRSDQVLLGAHRALFDEHLNLRLEHEQSLDANDSADYPTRTLLGADYLLSPMTTLYTEQEFTFGANEDTRGTRVGMRTRPWAGATLNTSLQQRNSSEYGPRLFASTGLLQNWKLSDAWVLSAGLDSSTTLRHPGDVPLSASLPDASAGTEDFHAVSLGAGYRQAQWSWTGRLEHRSSDPEERWGVYSAAAGEPRKGLGLSGRLQWFETSRTSGDDTGSVDLRLGLVQRPFARRWTILNRTDLSLLNQRGSSSEPEHWKAVNNLLVNYRRHAGQASMFYGAKYVREQIEGIDFSGYTDALGVELRHDIGKRWDVGINGSVRHSRNSDIYEYASGMSVGFNPATNLWVSAGYNWSGYEDNDFSLAGHTAQGPFVQLRYKFDQQSIRDVAGWFNREP